jgi:hypothetical protein
MSAARWVKSGIVGVTVFAATLAGCASGGPSASGPTGPTGPARSGSIGPGSMAVAQDAVGRTRVGESGTNCGGGPLDAGWPTTFAALGNPSTCLRDADAQGRAAYMNFTGRTYTNGAYKIALAVTGHSPMRVTTVIASATGVVHREAWSCPVPHAPIQMSVTFPANKVLPSVVTKRCVRT